MNIRNSSSIGLCISVMFYLGLKTKHWRKKCLICELGSHRRSCLSTQFRVHYCNQRQIHFHLMNFKIFSIPVHDLVVYDGLQLRWFKSVQDTRLKIAAHVVLNIDKIICRRKRYKHNFCILNSSRRLCL